MLLALGQRRFETASLEWSELKQTDRVWVIPGEKAKNGKTHIVHINSLAYEVLDAVARRGVSLEDAAKPNFKWPKHGYVFSTTGETPVSGYAKAKSKLDELMIAAEAKRASDAGEKPDVTAAWRFHDARRTMATAMQRLGIRFEVVEASLNHVGVSRSGVAAIYQRHSWTNEKREAFEAWAGYIESAIAGCGLGASEIVTAADNVQPIECEAS